MTDKKPGPPKGKKYQSLIRTPIASRIHQARKDRGITQGELAKRSLLSKRMIARYEENYTGSIKSVIRIAKALEVTVGYLIQDIATVEPCTDDVEPFMREYFNKLLALPPVERKHVLDKIIEASAKNKR
jgi:transcriptional regulator with XRE-family HTH domain